MKILIIRFSALGDILLTTPVLRCLKEQGGHELHFLTKKQNFMLIEGNPHIDQIHFLQNSLKKTIEILKKEKFDYVVDLHKNIRSLRIRLGINKLFLKSTSYPKHSLKRNIASLLHCKNILPKNHVVDRYFKAVQKLGIANDQKGLHYVLQGQIPSQIENLPPYIAVAVGSKHFTKQIPNTLLFDILANSTKTFVLLGDQNDADKAMDLTRLFTHTDNLPYAKHKSSDFCHILNLCGKLSFHQSAQVLAHSQGVISGDSSLMHLAAALNKNLISIWGSTVAQFGMYPYYAKDTNALCYTVENKNIHCRPCHKHGRKNCPKKHFKCMNTLSYEHILELLNQF